MKKLLLILLLYPCAVSAQPSIGGYTGTLTHGGTVTINGSSFGTKTVAAQLRWDNGEGSNLSTIWGSGNYGSTACGAITNGNLAYRTPIRSTALPYTTNGNTQYIAGIHCVADNGVLFLKAAHDSGTFPNYSRWVWYTRMDPAWDNTGGENTDANNKFYTGGSSDLLTCDSSAPGCGTAGHDGFWYGEYDGRPTSSSTSPVNIDFSDSGSLGYRCDSGTELAGFCHSGGGSQTVGYGDNSNNPAAGWVYAELKIRWDRNNTGRVKYYENGIKYFDATGTTDTYTTTTTRQEGIGLYARAREPNSFRYIDDVYHDSSLQAWAHAELCTGSTYTLRGICAQQPLTSWSTTAIGITVNGGKFAPSGAAYLYVCDSADSCNSSGFSVTMDAGGGGGGTSPKSKRRMIKMAWIDITSFTLLGLIVIRRLK